MQNKIASEARNLINSVPQAAVMTFAFSSTVYASSMAGRKQPSWGFEFRQRVLKTIVNNQVCFSYPLLPSQCLHLDLRYFGTNTFCHGTHFVFIYLFFFILQSYFYLWFVSLAQFFLIILVVCRHKVLIFLYFALQ